MTEPQNNGFAFSDEAIRLVCESDINVIADLFRLNYGHDYPFPNVFDGTWVKRAIYSDNVVCVVLEQDGEVIGTGAVLLDYGDYNDQLGELTRLAVHPNHIGHGAGRRIINALLEVVKDNVEFSFGETRTAHSFSQRMLDVANFSPIGFYPNEYPTRGRIESGVLYGKLHDHAQVLRAAEHPKLIPEIADLARHVLTSMHLPVDFEIVENSSPYPTAPLYKLKPADRDACQDLECIQRRWIDDTIAHGHQLEKPMFFGPISIDQGLPFTKRHGAVYLTAVDDAGEPLGAIGYLFDVTNQILKGQELLARDEETRGGLCAALINVGDEVGARIVEANVSAYDPRLQRTLFDLGFRPIAYGPAMVFHEWERLDVIKMIKLKAPYERGEMKLTEPASAIVSIVEKQFV